VILTPSAASYWPEERRSASVLERTHLHPGDVDVALDIDRYGFAVRFNVEAGYPVARMEKID
jgi:hypothetical protein